MNPSRILSTGLLAWFTVVALGVPLPSLPPVGVRAGGARFPCEDCPCGCGTAETCWQDCCCFTPGERLAWAEREGVRPPEFALAAAKQAGLEIAHWAESRTVPAPKTVAPAPAAACCCCSAKPSSPTSPAADACVVAAPRRAPATGAEQRLQQPEPGVSVLQSLACRGLQTEWLSLGSVTLVRPFAVTIELPAGDVFTAADHPAASPFVEIPTPPPRAAA